MTEQRTLADCLTKIRDELIAGHETKYPGMAKEMDRWLPPVSDEPIRMALCESCRAFPVPGYYVGDVHSVTRGIIICEHCVRSRAEAA